MSDQTLLAKLLEQETLYRLPTFGFDHGWELGATLYQLASKRDAPVAMEIFAFGQQVFLAARPGSCPENLQWIKRKRNTVLRSWHSSLYMGIANQHAGQPMEKQTFVDQAEYCDHGGSFPLRLTSGSVIGAITVSGLPAKDDHDLVVEALASFLAP